MKENYLKKLLSAGMILVLIMGLMVGCGKTSEASSGNENLTSVEESGYGILKLKVNPEIDIKYDEQGKVTEVKAANKDAEKILKDYKGFEGKECKVVVAELIKAIGAAGYFVEDVEGKTKKITIEVEKGSSVPSDTFMDDVAKEIKASVEENNWKSPLVVDGKEYYGESDYSDEDYSKAKAGDTKDSQKTKKTGEKKTSGNTDYGTTNYDDSKTNYGKTNYDDSTTNYGKTNYDDSASDYNNSDYGR